MNRILTLIIAGMLFSFAVMGQGSKRSASRFKLTVADSLFGAGAWHAAIPVYEGIVKTSADNSLAWSRLGLCYHNTADYDRAIASYWKALAYAPSRPLQATVHSRLARTYAMKNETEKAFGSLELALGAGYMNVGELQDHKDYGAIRSDERFAGVVTRATHAAMPCLVHEQSRQFDFWIGEWDVFPNGANVLVGQSRIEKASGGCMILENWTAVGPVPNTGKSMNYVNPATGKWEQFWIGSGGITANNPQKFVNGEYRDNAMRFTFEQVTPQGQKQTGRFIFFNEGPDQVRQFNEVSSDEGKTWTTVYDFIYKRKK